MFRKNVVLPVVFLAAFAPRLFGQADRTHEKPVDRLTYSEMAVDKYNTADSRKHLRQTYNDLLNYIVAERGFNPKLSYRAEDVEKRRAKGDRKDADGWGECGYHLTSAQNLFTIADALGMKDAANLWGNHVADVYLNGRVCEDSVRFNPEKAYGIYKAAGNQNGAKGAAVAAAARHLQIYFRGEAGSFYETWGRGQAGQPDNLRRARLWLHRAGMSGKEAGSHVKEFRQALGAQ